MATPPCTQAAARCEQAEAGVRLLIGLTVIVLLALQYMLWFGQSGHFAQTRLQQQLHEHQQRVIAIEERNQMLTAEVVALKTDRRALESRAREDLGMIREGEVFYLVPSRP